MSKMLHLISSKVSVKRPKKHVLRFRACYIFCTSSAAYTIFLYHILNATSTTVNQSFLNSQKFLVQVVSSVKKILGLCFLFERTNLQNFRKSTYRLILDASSISLPLPLNIFANFLVYQTKVETKAKMPP